MNHHVIEAKMSGRPVRSCKRRTAAEMLGKTPPKTPSKAVTTTKKTGQKINRYIGLNPVDSNPNAFIIYYNIFAECSTTPPM